MNLLLLFPEDFISTDRVRIIDQRLQHLLLIKKLQPGQQLSVGLLNANMGRGLVLDINQQQVEIQVQLDSAPPPPLNVHLILALPRPKMLKRILQTISAMGVKQVSLIHSAKVEKSYWQSPWLNAEKMQQHLHLGLQQAQDTMMPEVTCYQRFKPFVEDVLPHLAHERAIIAHPGSAEPCTLDKHQSTLIAIGPEGGFTDYERDKFIAAGFSICHLGERILRVENAIPALLGRLF